MKKLLKLFLILGAGLPLFAQDSTLTLIYKITDREAEHLYLAEDMSQVPNTYFHTLTDSVYGRGKTPPMPYGHYLLASPENERLIFELRSIYPFDLKLFENERDLMIEVVDTVGQQIRNARIRYNGKEVEPDEKTLTYRLPKIERNGTVVVNINGNKGFFDLSLDKGRVQKRSVVRRFFGTCTGQVILLPFNVIYRTYHFFKQGITRDRWRYPYRKLINVQKNKRIKGYIALNKPKYQPGDTVKIKAYVTNHKGKPWRKPLRLEAYDSRRDFDKVLVQQLEPISPGAYVHEFVPGDSLSIDRAYYLMFLPKNSRKRGYMRHSFRYEDYQLDEINFSLKSDKDKYHRGEKITLKVEAKDENNQAVPAGEVELVATRGHLSESYVREVLVPDTLWRDRIDLRADGNAQVVFPDSLLPDGNLVVKVRAEIQDVSGESHARLMTFTWAGATERIETSLLDGNFLARYFVNGEEKEVDGTIATAYPGGGATKKEVRFPLNIPYDPQAYYYQLTVGNINKTASLRGEEEIAVSTQKTPDSIQIKVVNPHQLSIKYQLFAKNGEEVRGQFTDPVWDLKVKGSINKAYFFRYQYVFNGATIEKEEEIRAYKKMLDIQLDKPDRVNPGETVQLGLQVKDYKGRAVKGTNIAAGAINAQFDGLRNVEAPKINFKPAKEPEPLYENLNKGEESKIIQQGLTQEWYQRLHLEEDLFYRLRFTEESVFLEYDTITSDSFYQEVAQFAPYVVENHQTVPIYLIYCNRQLVYYYDIDIDQPYSFVGKEGVNDIVIRTREYEYTLKNIRLKKGQKLTIAIDQAAFDKGEVPHFIKRKKMPRWATAQEKNLLRNSVLLYKNNHRCEALFWDRETNIHRVEGSNYRGLIKLGPFPGNSFVNFKAKDKFETRLKFDPGFEYDIQPERDRLFESEFMSRDKDVYYFTRDSIKPVNNLIYPPSIIENLDTKKGSLPRVSKYSRVSRSNTTFGAYGFAVKAMPKDKGIPYLVVLDRKGEAPLVFSASNKLVNRLSPGRYQFYYFLTSGAYLTKEIRIRRDSLLFQNFLEEEFIQDDSMKVIHEVLKKEPDEYGIQSPPKLNTTENPYKDSGRLISGTVREENGEPLIGAIVHILGTQWGTVTDMDGNYQLWVPENEEVDLMISYIGFNAVTLENVSSSVETNASLSSGVQLDEVVVTGLAVPKVEKDQTTSVTSLSLKRNISALAGTSAGVSSGEVSENMQLEVLEDEFWEGSPQGQGLRSEFRDYAFFEPNLITDSDGRAYFTVTYPDDITAWKTFALGMDRKGRGGITSGLTRSFKDLTGRIYAPRFLVEGDQVKVVGRSMNYTNDPYQVRTWFELDKEKKSPQSQILETSLMESLTIEVPNNTDTLSIGYGLEAPTSFDGEQRQIPILPQGVMEAEGQFYLLESDTTLEVSFNSDLGDVHLYIQDNLLNVLIDDLDYLKNYPYGCNEQIASRLLALLLDKKARALLNLPFEQEKDIKKMIARLQKAQNDSGAWGWWPGSSYNRWMTIYVLRALHQAQEQGYPTDAVEKGLRFLTSEFQSTDSIERLETLVLFSQFGQPMNYDTLLHAYDTMDLTFYDQLRILRIRQQNDIPYSLEILKQNRQSTIFGAHYWGEEGYRWDSSIPVTLLAYEILRDAGNLKALKAVRQYFLEQRSRTPFGRIRPGWRNTYETARILTTVLPDWMDGMGDIAALDNQVTFSGGLNKEIKRFPYTETITPGESLRIRKTGIAPLYFTAYQQFQNKDPKPRKGVFEVTTSMHQQGSSTEMLKKGEKAVLQVRLEVKEAANYVMLQVPVPAGCTYLSKPQNWYGPESHREYFKDHTAIFFDRIDPGDYTFDIPLEPRFEGSFTLNPAKAEQMYFPVFYGRNGKKQVVIEE